MSTVVVNTDLDSLPRALNNFIDQVPFAASVALNQTAFKLSGHKKTQTLPSELTLRNTYTQRGIKHSKSTKHDLTSEVGTNDWYVESLVAGGKRTAKQGYMYQGQRYLIVPSSKVKTKSGKIKKSAFKAKGKKSFVIKRGGKLLLVRRKGVKRYPLVYLGFLARETNYDTETLQWTKGERKFIPLTYRQEFRKAMVRAARNAR
jgi:hypothetical protein